MMAEFNENVVIWKFET